MAINPFALAFCLTAALPIIIIRVVVAYYISQDAKRYGIDASLYVILGFVLGLIGLIIWWVFREDIYKKRYFGAPPPPGSYPAYVPTPYYQVQAQRYGAPQTAQVPETKGKTLGKTTMCKECGHIQDTKTESKVMLCEICGASIRVG